MGLLRKNGFGRRPKNDVERGLSVLDRIQSGGKLYKIMASISMLGVFLAAGILVLATTQVLKISAGLFGTVVMIGILCIAIVSTLPWIRRIEKNEYKTVAIAFISVIGACALLWIISDWLVVAMITNHNATIALLWVVKIAVILSLQLMVADVVAMMYLKFGKTYLPFQIITYLSYGFIDFYLTFLFCCIHISGEDISLSPAFGILGSKWMITLIVLAVVYAAISNSILKNIQARRLRNMVNDYSDGKLDGQTDEDVLKKEENEEVKDEPKETPAEKLEKIKKLYEQELITKEEYEAKKSEILKDL